jgi:hypothetical protein
MPDKGHIKSQREYEEEVKMFELYKVAFLREELSYSEAVLALKMIGFSKTVAPQRLNKWKAEDRPMLPESESAKKKRRKEQNSLEARLFRRRRMSHDKSAK